MSLQPNAGSQGELAGLLAIRGYHRSRGDEQRDVCLIPASAHGTNAASAVMAGMRVVVVACDDDGNVDVDDLRAKADEHADDLAALMVTYPSTHGVFEERITEICDLVHEHGGQVYVDGANLNALVGVARPGWFGGDVSHLNLHKTFCIPHGGGGPGVGPVAVRAHLAPFLPNHPADARGRAGDRARAGLGRARGARPASCRSPGPTSRSWAPTACAGPPRWPSSTPTTSPRRLADHYPVLYTGEHGRVAHECILDLRADHQGHRRHRRRRGQAAHRLRLPRPDHELPGGGHADGRAHRVRVAGRARPVLRRHDRHPGRDRPRGRRRVAARRQPAGATPPTRPRTCSSPTGTGPYTREQAAYPLPGLRRGKYWPPVSRIDGGYGDRNLVCACPPPEAFERG